MFKNINNYIKYILSNQLNRLQKEKHKYQAASYQIYEQMSEKLM